MANCNCGGDCNCKKNKGLSGKTKKVKTGGRVTNNRYEHTPQTKKELNNKTKSNRKSLYASRVAKGQMTKERAKELEARDKKLNFH